MKIGYIVATTMVGGVVFAAGLLARPLLLPEGRQQDAVAQTEGSIVEVQHAEILSEDLAAAGYLSVEELKVRIDDGEVQWFDGMIWHTVSSVEEMQKEDKFYLAQEAFRLFEEQMRQQGAESDMEESEINQAGTLSVGQKKEPKPAEKPKPTKPVVTEPVIDPSLQLPIPGSIPTPAPDNIGQPSSPDSGGNSGGNSGGGSSGGGDGGSSGSGGGDGGNSGSDGGDSGSSGGGDTGDGENMEWSDDYL